MCRIERFDVVYPDGTREGRERVVTCPRGTRSQPCRHTETVRLEDRLASASDLRPLIQPRIVPIEPRGLESSPLRPSSREKRRGLIEGVALQFNLWNPFSSKKKEKKGRTEYYVVNRTRKPEHPPGVNPYQPPEPPPLDTAPQGGSPVVIPVQPSDHHNAHRPPERKTRGRTRPPAVVIDQFNEVDEDESPSPPEAIREHGRRTRSLSPHSRYEIEKESIRQRELGQRERQERNKREEREARERAERLERERIREEESERQQRQEIEERRRRVFEREARRQQEEREQARIRQEREDRERLGEADRARQAREERAWRRQEEEYRQRAADRERLREADRARQARAEGARRRQEEEDRQRAADRDRLRRDRDEQDRRQYAEQQRIARAHRANIPRPPRHPPFVHQNEGHLDRGDRFIHTAIREENLRRFERGARLPRGWYDDGALRRRNTIDGGQRRYDEQRWRR